MSVFDQGWRENHAMLGDRAVMAASNILDSLAEIDGVDAQTHVALTGNVRALAAIAQAHYAAANVRARPVTGPAKLRTKTPYVIPGVEGQWEIRGMSTENFGATGDVELRLYRVGE
jgi:hypothetical protein